MPSKRFTCHGCGRRKKKIHHRRDGQPYCVACWKSMYS